MLIPLPQLIKKYGITLKGVMHLGAHQAEEAGVYHSHGASNVIWVEGNPELMPVLEEELKKYPGQKVFNLLVSDEHGKEVSFKVTNNFQSSSMLDFGTHQDHFPGVKVHHTLYLKTSRLDKFIEENNLDISDSNFLNIDLQGAELMAIKGLGNYLKNFDYVYTEVNIGRVYVGCATLYELDRYMHQMGFYRVELKLTKWQWGDAFYVKKESGTFSKKIQLAADVFYQLIFNLRSLTPRFSNFVRRSYYYMRSRLSLILRGNRNQNKVMGQVDMTQNGELFFIQYVLSQCKEKLILFDVGANEGNYTQFLIEQLEKQGIQDYEIHLFEPQQTCYESLKKRFSSNSKIAINKVALSDESGDKVIFTDFQGSSSASLYNRKEIKLEQQEMVTLSKLSEYITNRKIPYISLLKIDTEGNEKKVLLGAESYLTPDIIRAVQFEYGGTYLDAGITLAEVVQLLMKRGFAVGKLEQNKIDFKSDLGDFMEDYTYSNYVAVKKT